MDNTEIIKKTIQEEVREAFITYSLSVIIGRAIPEVRDGLKPVHRRILWNMHDQNMTYDKPTKKSARIVGDVIGRYHPHGDQSVYDALVRLAQEFSLRYPLIIGQGNFGSIDGDMPAAYRYTEAKMSKIASKLLEDIDRETVDFSLNFDDTLKEPDVLPASYPNLFVNGAEGIAVGMTTSIPPHNLTEVTEAVIHYIENKDCEIDDLLNYVKGPDFPTRAYLLQTNNFYQAYKTGKGKFIIRGKARIEIDEKDKYIIIEELPYQVNKAEFVKKIARLARNDVIQGIADLRDESDENIRVLIRLKRNFIPKVVLNKLYKHTPLQKSFNANIVAINKGKPETFNLKEYVKVYYEHKKDVLIKRFKYLLKKAKARLHILEGLLIALQNIDEVIKTIKESKNTTEARHNLMSKFQLSEKQSQAILDMRLQKLTGLEVERLKKEYEKIKEEVEKIEKILSTQTNIDKQVINELREIIKEFGDERRTQIIQDSADTDINLDIVPEDVIVLKTKQGYIKRMTTAVFNVQGRGGKGRRGVKLVDEDKVDFISRCSTENFITFFTNTGKAYSIKVNDIADAKFYSKGSLVDNYISLEEDEEVKNIEIIKDFEDKDKSIFFVTKSGITKRVALKALRNSVRRNGIKYAEIREGDSLVDSVICTDNDEVLIATRNAKGIKFKTKDVREMGRGAIGVKGINLSDDDRVVSLVRIDNDRFVLVVTNKGYAKKVKFSDFPSQKRGGKGVNIVSDITKAGNIMKILLLTEDDKILIATTDGNTIKIDSTSINVQKRNTKGVRIVRLNKSNFVSDITKI